MAKPSLKYSYPARVLIEQGMKLYAENKQLFSDADYIRNIPLNTEIQTRIYKGKEFYDADEEIQLNTYEEILRYGLCIIARQPHKLKFAGQRTEYALARKHEVVDDLGEIPVGHKVVYYPSKKIARLLGKNSWGFQTAVIQNILRSDPLLTASIDQFSTEYAKQLMAPLNEDVRHNDYIDVPEIPIVISPEQGGLLICLPHDREDRLTVFAAGAPGKGKSMLLHSIADTSCNKLSWKLAILNDIERETYCWGTKWDKHHSMSLKRQIINEESVRLPIVHLHPKTNTLKNSDMVNRAESGFVFSLEAKTALRDFNQFFKSRKDWVFSGRTEERFKNLLRDELTLEWREDGLVAAKTLADVEEAISVEKVESSRDKIYTMMKGVMSEKIFDTHCGVPSKWVVDDGTKQTAMYPWNACLAANLVPCIVCKDLKTKPYYADYISFIINDLFEQQRLSQAKSNLLLLIDEIHRLKEHFDIIDNVFREGRHERIGVLYGTQVLSEISQAIINNTDYCIVFNTGKHQVDEIIGRFPYMEEFKKSIPSLQRFECVVGTTDKLVIYNMEGERSVVSGRAFKGIILPPLSAHGKPTDKALIEQEGDE